MAHEAEAPASVPINTWTAEPPRAPGWYWFADGPTVPWAGTDSFYYELLYVFLHDDLHRLCMVNAEQCRPGRSRRVAMEVAIYVGCGYWYGPLAPPELTGEMMMETTRIRA